MRVIPAIDIIDGRPVRLSGGDYGKKTSYQMTALEAAKSFEDGGLSFLHLVDLDAAAGRGSNLGVLEEIASSTSLRVDFGGGVRSEEAVRAAFNAGAEKVNVGSMAARDAAQVAEWGRKWPGRIILSADGRDGIVAVSGWMESTGLEIIPFIKHFMENGITEAVVTDISRDGMLSGPSFGLYRKILAELPGLDLVASGGVSLYDDLVSLAELGLGGTIVGKAYYEGRLSIGEMKEAECLPRG